MKSEKLLYALTGARDDFIDQSAPPQPTPARPWLKYAAIAACLCAALAGALTLASNRPAPTAPDGLPLIDLPELGIGGMGFEGYMYYDASEIENGNPWREDMLFETMPVFKNGAYYNPRTGYPVGLDEDEVMRRLTAAAEAMGLEILETDYYMLSDIAPDDYPDEIYRIEALTDYGEIYAYTDGIIGYFLDDGMELPEGCSMTFHDTTAEQALETTKYLAEKYAELLNFDEPAFIVSGDYNIYGEYGRDYDAYDASGDDLQDILNYAFCRVSFSPDDDGRFHGLWLFDYFPVLGKIGDYPIIGIDEARERLLSGLYQTSVPYDMPGEEYIVKVELMYRRSLYEEVLLPYYRFYVELEEAKSVGSELGLKTFGAYYVPAIESRYIGNAETYHGQFN